MKQGLPAFQNVTSTTHIARQMQSYHDAAASARALHVTNSTPLGAHMQEQFSQHVQSSMGASVESGFIEPLLSLVGQECVQVLLLRARAAFTELVEKSMDEGDIFGLEATIKNARSLVIGSLTGSLAPDVRAALTALQCLLQEQQHAAANLAATADPVSMWESEMRFYARHGGHFECRCVGHRVMINPDTMDPSIDSLLVTTDVTREVRRAFFHAAFGGGDVLVVDGVAGTGKTETCRDICAMLGRNAVVLDGEKLTTDWDWLSVAQPGNVVIIDSANQAPRSVIENAVQAAKAAKIPLCLAANLAGASQCSLLDVVGSCCAYVQTSVPDYSIVLSSMLACEGLQQADDLGYRLHNLFNYFKRNCSKQNYYDFGLRKLKTVSRESGRLARMERFSDERQVLTAAVQGAVGLSMAPIDQPAFIRGILEHIGADAFVPMQIPSDFWNAAATKISSTVARRHASLCLPVVESEEPFVMAVLEEEAGKLGADITYVPGRVADLSTLDMFGNFVNGEWRDGSFTKALRDVVSQDRPGWLVAFCGSGKLEPEKWERLNSLMDDNKCLRLESGETIKLRPDDRIIFAAPGLETATPATISRLGIVNLDAHHRQRL